MADHEEKVSNRFRELFHYTNLAAFGNIYKTQQFWATHYEGLNDSAEFSRFRLHVSDFIRPKIREIFDKKTWRTATILEDINRLGGVDFFVRHETERLLNKVHSHTFGRHMYKDTFIASFCAHTQPDVTRHGLLSQWRGYGADGGIAIVLDTLGIEDMMRRDYERFQFQLMYIADVIYDDDDLNKIEAEFSGVYNSFPEILRVS